MVDLVVTLVKHQYAEDIFNAAFLALDLESLFPWAVTSYYNKECMFMLLDFIYSNCIMSSIGV